MYKQRRCSTRFQIKGLLTTVLQGNAATISIYCFCPIKQVDRTHIIIETTLNKVYETGAYAL